MPIARKLWTRVGYVPHPKQLEFHSSNARFKVAVAGRRFGKSRMATAEVMPDIFRTDPPTRGFIIGPSYILGEKEFRYLWEDIVIKMGLGPQIRKKAYNQRTGEMYIVMPWGSRIDVMTGDNPDSLVGEGLDWVIFSEAAKLNPQIWEKYVRPALSDRHGRAIFPSTPEGFNWYRDLYLRGQSNAPKDAEWESWRYPAWENPYVYPKGYDDPEIKGQMGTEEGTAYFWQEIGADFRSVVGLIYNEFDDRVHVKPWTYDPNIPNYLFFDYGFTNPFVCLDVQVTSNDEVHIWREYYHSGISDHKHAKILRDRANPPGYRIDGGFGDSASPGTTQTLGEILSPRIVADPDSKVDVGMGIQEVKKILAGPEGSRLTVDPACEMTIWEFQNYRAKEQRARGIVENNKEDPKKYADHAMDAIRYGIMHLFVLGSRHHLDDSLVEIGIRQGEGTFFQMNDSERITTGGSQW